MKKFILGFLSLILLQASQATEVGPKSLKVGMNVEIFYGPYMSRVSGQIAYIDPWDDGQRVTISGPDFYPAIIKIKKVGLATNETCRGSICIGDVVIFNKILDRSGIVRQFHDSGRVKISTSNDVGYVIRKDSRLTLLYSNQK